MDRHAWGLIVLTVFLCLFGNTAASSREQSPLPAVASGWRIKFDGSGSAPVLVENALYVGSADGALYALDANTGALKWRFQTGENLSGSNITTAAGSTPVEQLAAGLRAAEAQHAAGVRRIDMTPAFAEGTVFIGSGDRSFYAIDAATGTRKWAYVAGAGMASSTSFDALQPPAITDNDVVYFVTEDGLHALEMRTGHRKWLFETLQEVPASQMNGGMKRTPSAPVLAEGTIYLTAWPALRVDTPLQSFLYAVDASSGKTKWVRRIDGLNISPAVAAHGFVFVSVEQRAPDTSSGHAVLYAVAGTDGQVAWKYDGGSAVQPRALSVAGETVLFSDGMTLSALEFQSGRSLWKFSVAAIGADMLADGQRVYVTGNTGTMTRPKVLLHALALDTGAEVWSRKLNAALALLQDGTLYADGDRLHALSAATGQDLWTFKGTGRESTRLIAGGKLFMSSPTTTYIGTTRVDQGYLYALDARTGQLIAAPER